MASVALNYESLNDVELAKRIAQRDALAVRVVTSRNNQRLYRTAWSVLKDRADAEEAVQEAYLKAFAAIDSFAGNSSLSTWLTRIVLNEAFGGRRSQQRKLHALREQSIAFMDDYRENLMRGSASPLSPEADVACGQVAKLLERAIEELPEEFRTPCAVLSHLPVKPAKRLLNVCWTVTYLRRGPLMALSRHR